MNYLKQSTLKNTANDNIRVLIVEDEPMVADMINQLLCGYRPFDFTCSTVETLAEGLALLKKTKCDVLLLDLGLPDSSGLETAAAVRREFPDVPIIVLTGLADEETALEAMRMDVQDYLLKGQITADLLARSVRYSLERKRSFDALRESEAKYRGLFDTMTEAFDRCEIIVDAEGRPVDFRYLDVNRAWERVTGISADRARGRTARELVPDVDRGLMGICGNVALSGKPVLFNQYNKRLDKWFEVYIYSPGKGYFATFSRDITDHIKAEEALRQSEERLRLAAQAASFGTYDIDIEAGELHRSPGLLGLYGLPPDAAACVPLAEGLGFIHPDDLDRVALLLKESMDPRGTGYFRHEHRIIRKDGQVLWVNMRGRTFFEGEQRKPVRTTGVLLDITDRKRTEEALRENEARYRALAHTASSVVWRTSADGTRLIELSGAVANECREPEQQAGDWIRYIHPDDRARTEETWKKAVETKSLYEVEHRNLHPDGTYHYFLSRGVPVIGAGGEVREWIGSSIDITERRRAEQGLRESEERFRTLADNIAQLAWMADDIGNVFWYNKRWYDYSGAGPEDMQGLGWRKLVHPDHSDRVNESLEKATAAGTAWEETFPIRGRDGQYRWYLCQAVPIRSEKGSLVRWFATGTDITERMQMMEEIRQMAQHDMLTGLPNRRLFNEIISVELAQARRNGKKIALFFLDLDRFKEINDTLGHDAGDELLKQTALRLRSVVRTSDTVARMGGDEFNVLIPDIAYPEYASEVAQKILSEIRSPFQVNGHELNVSTSIGISVYPDDGKEIDALMRYADIAMYYAKEHGRNMYQFYNPVINTRSQERIRFEASLRRALERNEFTLYYQPLVDLGTGKIISAEVLLRWRHPEQGLLLPAQFMESAEAIGFMGEIDDWVLWTTGNQIRSWIDHGMQPFSVTINISNRQFHTGDLVERMSGILKAASLPAWCVDIEITESTAMSDITYTTTRLKHMTEKGIHVSIDNFGSGCSSLRHLRELQLQKLKIDRSFIKGIGADGEGRSIISAVLLLAHALKLKVVATGVEGEDQLSFLRESQCDEAQGYLFGGPVPADRLREMVMSQ